MDFWILLIGIVTLVVLFPYIRCLIIRLSGIGKIKKVCKIKGYKLYPTHKLWYLGSNRNNKCDFYIETYDEVLSVKLFASPRYRVFLIIKESGEYFFRSFLAIPYYISIIIYHFDHRLKLLPDYDFNYLYKKEWNNKKVRKIILINPVPMLIRQLKDHEGEYNLNDGDMVFGMEVNSLHYLLKYLK